MQGGPSKSRLQLAYEQVGLSAKEILVYKAKLAQIVRKEKSAADVEVELGEKFYGRFQTFYKITILDKKREMLAQQKLTLQQELDASRETSVNNATTSLDSVQVKNKGY